LIWPLAGNDFFGNGGIAQAVPYVGLITIMQAWACHEDNRTQQCWVALDGILALLRPLSRHLLPLGILLLGLARIGSCRRFKTDQKKIKNRLI